MSTDLTVNKRPLGTRWCSIGSVLSGVGLVLAALGALGGRYGLLKPLAAFSTFGVGLLLCVLALVVLLIGLLLSKGSGGGVAAGRAWGAWVAAALLLVFSWSQRPAVDGAPAIHDVTTDVDNPPAFVALVPVREADGAQNPPGYASEFASAQQTAFPDLQTLVVDASPAEAFAAAQAVAGELGWDIAAADAATGRLEATDSTKWFGFRDDVVVRVVAEDGGSAIDVRSKSRVGRGDMGTNASRIREFLARLRAAIG